MSEISKEQVVDYLSNLTVLELAELTKELEDKWGVTAAAPMAMAMPVAGGGEAAAAVEEPTEFNVVLDDVGAKKIQVIKVVRALTGLGLKEAKEVVDGAPSTVKESISKEEAEDYKKQLEEVGATISIKPA